MNTASMKITVANLHKVPKRQWKKWNLSQQIRFNFLFSTMMNNQDLFKHPKAPDVDLKYWKTTCWNAALMANDV